MDLLNFVESQRMLRMNFHIYLTLTILYHIRNEFGRSTTNLFVKYLNVYLMWAPNLRQLEDAILHERITLE